MRKWGTSLSRAAIRFFKWQKRFASDEACSHFLARERWPDGFICPRCAHEKAHRITTRRLYQCARCRHQVSVIAGTLFHSSNVALRKWFWAIYGVGSDKGGLSALRLSKLLDVSWPTVQRMLRKRRIAMGHRDSRYRLRDWIELEDALVGEKRPVKRPCWWPVKRGEGAGFLAMEVLGSVSKAQVGAFATARLMPEQTVFSDALPALNSLAQTQLHCAEVTPAKEAPRWLPWVHIAIANLKRFLLGTFHGVSATYLQEYLNEFCYRFNRRFWEGQLPTN